MARFDEQFRWCFKANVSIQISRTKGLVFWKSVETLGMPHELYKTKRMRVQGHENSTRPGFGDKCNFEIFSVCFLYI